MTANVISIVAIVVAIVAAVLTWRIGKKQADTQERLLALERERDAAQLMAGARANIRGEVIRDGGGFKLRVRNGGPAEARFVSVHIDGEPAERSAKVVGFAPIGILGDGAERTYFLSVALGDPTHWHVTIQWFDAAGRGRWESELSL